MKASFRFRITSLLNRAAAGRRHLLLASSNHTLFAVAAAVLATGAMWSAGARAQDSQPAAPPSTTTVAQSPAQSTKAPADSRGLRLSTVEGQVRVEQDGQVLADPAYANMPIFEGSQIETGNDGRAEIQMEDGSLARLSPNTTLTVSVLQGTGTHARTELVLNGGLAYFELQPTTPEHSLRVSYGSTSFNATSFSVVRITEDAPPGEIAVFSGNVHLDRGNALQMELHGGESVALDANDITKYTLNESIDANSWDSWNTDRDQLLNTEAGDQTVASSSLGESNPEPGTNDLDASGNWYDVPGTGYVWSPYEAISAGAGWDPYGYGHWVYYPRYGYVWVSGYGWGYAPYQCGLWNYYDSFGWGWQPGVCNTWWSGGFDGGGWGYNIGNYPRGYHPPRRPMPGPIPPRRPRGPGFPGGLHPLKPVAVPVIPVGQPPLKTSSLPVNSRTPHPILIGGHTVQPLRPLASRQAYGPSVASTTNRPGSAIRNETITPAASTWTGYGAGSGPNSGPNSGYGSGNGYVSGGSVGGGALSNPHPVYGQPGRQTFEPQSPTRSPEPIARPVSPAPYRPAPAPAPYRPAPAPAPHPTNGGGGGGGGHASSGGGGGGGGGGSHSSSGGGGGGGTHK